MKLPIFKIPPSCGSPVVQVVGQLMLVNPDLSIDQIEETIRRWTGYRVYESVQGFKDLVRDLGGQYTTEMDVTIPVFKVPESIGQHDILCHFGRQLSDANCGKDPALLLDRVFSFEKQTEMLFRCARMSPLERIEYFKEVSQEIS